MTGHRKPAAILPPSAPPMARLTADEVKALQFAVGVLTAHASDAGLNETVRLTFVDSAITLNCMIRAAGKAGR